VEEYPGTLVFQLQRTADNQDAWIPILSRPGLTPVPVVLSVGLPGGSPVPTQWIDFQLTVLHPDWLVAWGILFLVAGGFFFYAAKKSSMLRESGPVPAGSEAALSLGRCQMAWWFFIILAAYLFLFMVTWDYDTITAGTLGLMGIAAGTAMAGATVDTSENSSMAAEKAQLQTESASVPPPTAAAPPRSQSISRRDKQLNTPLHTMPNSSATLLGLMGISAGTYVGFKLPGQKN
jgi:hypothetical protein